MPVRYKHRKSYIGQKFNLLTVVGEGEDIQTHHGLVRTAVCQCDCGNTTITRLHPVRSGATKSCGCWKIQQTKNTMTTHGLTTTKKGKKIYVAWSDIKRRCYDPEHREYKRYGAEGVTLAQEWIDDPVAFSVYVDNLPNFSFGMSVDRVDNDKGYEPGNLRWATKGEQVRNRGKNENNTSGKCGVTWYLNDTGGTRAIAWWIDGGKTKSKSFSEKKYGLIPAFSAACKYREQMIQKLNEQGAGYSDKHGK